MTNTTEYPIWGVPPGATDETLLYTLATTPEEAKRVKGVLEGKGCTAVRIQTLDLSAPPDPMAFARALNLGRRRRRTA